MSLLLAELIALSIVLVVASYVGVFFDFKSKLAHDKILTDSTASKAILHKNVAIRAIALALAVVCSFLLKSTYDEWKDESRTPNISFQKLAIFMERIGDDTYKVGIEVKLFNSDSKPYLVKGMELSFDRSGVALVPRGGFYLQRIMISRDHLEINEDNYLKPYMEGYYKTELPVLVRMKVIGGQPPELLFFGKWKILLGEKTIDSSPLLYANSPEFTSPDEWNEILKPSSKIDMNNFTYKKLPDAPPGIGKAAYYLLYNEDKSMSLDIFGFSNTNYQRGDKGVLVFIGGSGSPNLKDGWIILGRTYKDVWNDSEKLKLYDSIVPPEKNGEPRPFGYFSGAEAEMNGK